MSPSDYTEEQLVEQPAIGLFAELGWTTLSASDETFGTTGTLPRETKSDVVLISKLRSAMERLNLRSLATQSTRLSTSLHMTGRR